MNRRELLGLSLTAAATNGMSTDPIEVVHTLVFAASPNGGNPCPVVRAADHLTDAQMLDLARRFGQDMAFVLQPRSKAADLRIRYFVPDHEMGVSGHATIAAITVALSGGRAAPNRMRIETTTGIFEAAWLHGAVTLEQNPPIFGANAPPGPVAHALNIQVDGIASGEGPVESVSASRAKLLIPLRNSGILNRLKPNFDALWTLCDALQVSGFYPFTRHTDKAYVDAEARQFPLRAGFPEDAATGVAAAALGAYLAKHHLDCRAGRHEFRFAQGYAMGAPSLIEAIAECADGKVTRTAIRGTARIISRETIRL